MAKFWNQMAGHQPKFRYSGLTDIGQTRQRNEDCFAVLQSESFFALADGMGGHQAGDIASQEAIAYLCQAVRELFSTSPKLSPEKLTSHISHIYQNVNAWVHHLGSNLSEYQGMGTTLSSALLYEDSMIISHIGDSRVYQIRQNKMRQITTDHSAYNRDPHLHIKRKVLTQIIGSQKKITTDISVVKVRPKDLFLICSDGLTDCVKEEDILTIIAQPLTLEERSQSLIQAANARGGIDNITVLLIEVS